MSITFAGNPNEARRRASSKALILAALQQAGARGCTNDDLNAIAFRYGGRLHELRREGYVIASLDEGEGRWRFVLRSASTAPTLASLQPVACLDHRGYVQPLTPSKDVPAATGRLF